MINGDRIQSVKVTGTNKGASQRGEFFIKFRTDGSSPNNPIGQYGLIDFVAKKYNSIGNKNAIRFSDKSNITITTELVGVSEVAVDGFFTNKALIRSTFQLTHYVNPVVLYSNVDSSEISSGLGTITINPYPITKVPYKVGDGGIAFDVYLATFRDAINWTLKVNYETTPLINPPTTPIAYPPIINNCELWLDASNEKSVVIDSLDRVQSWNDISA